VVRVAYADIAKSLQSAPFASKKMGIKASIGSWGLHVERAGQVTVRPSGDKVCAAIPIVANGHIAAFGKKLERRFRPTLTACARPVLGADKTVRLEDPDVRMQSASGSAVDLNARVLRENLTKYLQGEPRQALSKWLKGIKIPIHEPIAAFTKAISKPIAMKAGKAADACLVLAPTRVVVSQPEADPSYLRLSVSVQCRPTVQSPCATQRATSEPPYDVVSSIDHEPTRLVVPVQVPLAPMQDPVTRELAKRGPIKLNNGEVHVGKVTLATAPGRIIAYADIRGQVTDSLLFVSYTRDIDGRFAVWGAPIIRGDRIVIDKPNVALESGDVVADLLVALQRKRVVNTIARHLEIPQHRVLGGARKRLQSLAKGVKVGGKTVPVRVDVKKLRITRIIPRGGNLDVHVAFEGWVVVGDVRRK